MTYASLPPGSVLRCPVTGDVYTRLTDGEERDWVALHVLTAARVLLDPKARGDAIDLLASAVLPPRLVLHVPVVVEPEPEPEPTVDADWWTGVDALMEGVFAPLDEVAR